MCRLILAVGSFDPGDILAAAVAMSRGETADHDNATVCHAHGWGAVWRDRESGALVAHRDERPIWAGAAQSPLAGISTDFLAIHARNASLPEKQGIGFTHPLTRDGDDWYFMHNGYLPTVHRLVGLDRSEFDSAEYFDYLVPRGATGLNETDALGRLRALPPGGSTSGNAIAIHPRGAYLVHWSPADTPTPRFFTMHRLSTADADVFSSERVPGLAAAPLWRELDPRIVLTIPFHSKEID